MLSAHAIPLLLISLLVGLLLGVLVWGFWRAGRGAAEGNPRGSRDDVLLGLLILAAFAMGVFLAYALLNANLLM